MAYKRILLGLTTTRRSDWREKTGEIIKYGIKEIALFPTVLPKKERRDLYDLLEKIPGLKIPHVHLRGDFDTIEMDYLVKNFETKLFNIHSANSQYPHPEYIEKYADRVYIENTNAVPEEAELEKYAGLCPDFSHWEDYVRRGGIEYTDKLEKLSNIYKIGCCHISGVSDVAHNDEDASINRGVKIYSAHFLENLKDMNYVEKYKKYLPEYISIELENSFEEQLKVKNYLDKMINE